jgi:N-acetylglutamate synthase-like GNAT family acetyltransferase
VGIYNLLIIFVQRNSGLLHTPAYSRLATTADLELLVKFINKAFARDNYFKRTERTNSEQMTQYLQKGNFLLLEERGELVGLVYVELRENGRGSIGLLTVNPDKQGRGTGMQLMQSAEGFCHDHGRSIAEIDVINLRPELVDWYRRQGYRVVGEAPYPRPEILIQPCHFIAMQKNLSALES